MQRTVTMPKLGMTMTEGVLVRWRIAAGDTFAKDDVLAEVETDKVELEVEAQFAGRAVSLFAEAGQAVPVGAPLLLAETDIAAPTSAPTAPAAVPAAVPTGAENGNGHTLVHDAPTDAASAPAGDALSTQRILSTPAARRLAQDRGIPLEDIARLRPPNVDAHTSALRAADVLAFQPSAQPSAPPAAPTERAATAPLTPLARKIAEANALSAAEIAALGELGEGKRAGRQVVEQVLAARSNGAAAASASAPAAPAPVATTAPVATSADAGKAADTDFTPLTSMRRIIAERTAHSFASVPHIYLDVEVDMTEADAVREAQRAAAARRGAEAVTATALLVRVAAAALARVPGVNASYVPAQGTRPAGIQRWRGVHVGVAVAVPNGLVVPVIRDADRKSLAQIGHELNVLAQKAREGKLQPDDLTGGTFSISNLGMYGIDTFHAVINEPQSAILAVGRAQRRPVVVTDAQGNETVAIRSILKVSLSADHRAVDGAAGAEFLREFRELLEQPRLML